MNVKSCNDDKGSHKKIALITGSATGIGANISIDLASAGYHVILTGRNIKKLNQVAEQCKSADIFVADLYELEQVDLLIKFIHEKFNRLDVLVNNACWRGPVQNITNDGVYEELEKVLHINLSVPLYLIHKALVPMQHNNSSYAVVLNISSIASQRVVPLHLYSISKACLSEMSKQLAQISQTLKLFFVTISPGPVLTAERPHHTELRNQTLLHRVATTEEISNFVVFVLSKAHLFNGKELYIDGGALAKGLTHDGYESQNILCPQQ